VGNRLVNRVLREGVRNAKRLQQRRKEEGKKKKTDDDDEEEEEEEEEEEGGGGGGGSDHVRLELDTKFWEYSLKGKKVTVRYGKIGSDGREEEKSFPNEEKARKFADSKQRQKENKGYEVVSGGGGSKKKKSSTKGKGSNKGSNKGSSKKGKGKGSNKGSNKGSSKKGKGGGGKTRLTSDSSSGGKFWEIEVSGSDVTTRWGKEGTDGAEKSKSFPSAEKAQKEAEKQIKAKKRNGYS